MKHGGDILTYKDAYQGDLIDFSSNINPLGFPEVVKRVMMNEINDLTRYPDIRYRELRHELAGYLGCQEDEILLGNGAVEIIDNIIMMFERVLAFVPCFCEYIDRAHIHNKETILLPLDGDFEIDLKLLKNTIRSGDLVILGNPNNPSGKRIPVEKLEEIVAIIEAVDAFLLLDEAFYEFCATDYDSISRFHTSKRVCIIRAATKFFALPGVRLGYGFTCKEIAERYNLRVLPWSINAVANAVGLEIFREEEYIKYSKIHINEQRKFLLSSLRKLNNIKVYETDCNFILIELLKSNESKIFDYFLSKGILLRKASSFEGLDEDYIRVAVKSHQDNIRLIECFQAFENEME